ncbi:MAG: peptidyl-tRNA hydrolase [Candidatus Aenigmarchaeota archaeon]|nr:peptidyl-tRNA hydrolase [Candidatus Aenigmarchaeota archaeon]
MAEDSVEGYKQAILVRTDLKMGKGKIAAQASHASLAAYEKVDSRIKRKWKAQGCKKIVLKVNGEKELLAFRRMAGERGLPNELIMDAGLTQIPSSTITCLGIGPAEEERVDKLVGNLKLL